MLRAILNKSWRLHSTKQHLYGHLPPVTKTIKFRRTRPVGHCWRSKDKLISAILREPLHMALQGQDNQLESTYSSSVPIRNVALKTCQKQSTIKKGGQKGSWISMLMVRYDDDDDGGMSTAWRVISCQSQFKN